MPIRCLTLRDYADEKRVTVRTVRRWIASGRVPVHRYSKRTLRIFLSDLPTDNSKTPSSRPQGESPNI